MKKKAGSQAAPATTVLTDTQEFDLSEEAAINRDFFLKPYTGEGAGTGSINLALTFDSGVSADSITYILIKLDEENSIALKKNTISGNTNNGKWAVTGSFTYESNPIIKITSINSGVYHAVLSFYNSDGDDKVSLYSVLQEINVFPGMETNRWVLPSDFLNENGYFKITQAMVDNYIIRDFYVGNCGTATPDDSTGNGGPYKPYATVAKAVDVIKKLPLVDSENNTIEYTIHVKDGTQNNVESQISINRHITIECWKYDFGDTKGSATLTWNSETTGSMFSIKNNSSLTIEGVKSAGDNPTWSGLVLDGNKGAGKTGQGITIDLGVSGVLQMKGGEIRNFNSGNTNGPGIAVNGRTASFVMTGGKISSNETSGSGGGVYAYLTPFTMTDGLISGNKAQNGGGIALQGSSTSDSSSAIMNMKGGVISGNTAITSGGGIYNTWGTIYMSGNAIVGDSSQSEHATAVSFSNKARDGGGIFSAGNNNKLYLGYTPNTESDGKPVPDNDFSGGIFYNYSTQTSIGSGGQTSGGGLCLHMTEMKLNKCKIMNNGAGCGGGGIITSGSASCLIGDDSIISGNSANGFGFGVYFNSTGSFCIEGSAYLAHNDDIYLGSGKIITITGALNPPAEANGKVATITPGSYNSTNPVLEVSTDPDPTTTLADECGKFAVTPNNSVNYRLGSDGKLHKIVSVSNPTELQNAIQAASTSGDAITISDNIAITQGFSGTESQKLSIDGNNVNRLKMESSTSDIEFQCIDFTNGKINTNEQEGGMLSLNGNGSNSLTIKNCSFRNCSTYDRDKDNNRGGALYIAGFKNVTIEDCEFSANNGDAGSYRDYLATSGGFIYLSTPEGATVYINRCSFTGGYASHGGAIAIHLDDIQGTVTTPSEMNIDSCTFTKNHADWNGGAIDFSKGSKITIKNSTFTDNAVDNFNGEIGSGNVYIHDNRTVTLTGSCTIDETEIIGAQENVEKTSSF